MELNVYILLLVGCFMGNTIAAFSPGVLEQAVLKDYNKNFRPVGESRKTVNVSHDLIVIRVHSLEDQSLTLSVWIHMAWNDPGLEWGSKYYGLTVNELHIPSRLIWLPDIVLYNSADEIQGSLGNDLNAVVQSDGNVTYFLPTKLRSNCRIKGKTMKRHHKVICEMKFGSWTYDGSYVDIHSRSGEVDFDRYFPNQHWKVVKTTVERKVTEYLCCPETYVSLTYTFTFKYRGG